MIIEDNGGLGFVIKEIYVFIVTHADGDEAVPAVHSVMGWLPMIAADTKNLDEWRRMAKQAATEGGKQIRLVRFTAREELEVIEP